MGFFRRNATLEYQLKAAKAEILAFESGEKYLTMQEEHKGVVRFLERTIKALEEKLALARREIRKVRDLWFEVFEDLKKESETALAALSKSLARMEERALRAERQRDEAKDKVGDQRQKIYELETLLEEEKGKNLKLTAQVNRDFENSSLPSSKSIKRKKITNGREKTGRKPGGQPGHEGHRRKRQEPTAEPVVLLPPKAVLDDPEFKKTRHTIVKQLVSIRLTLDVTQYQADVYYNSKTGERIHGAFPEGVVDDVNYDGSIKAFLYLLNNDCHVSIDKCGGFLSDLTGGKLVISKGMINKLGKEFAQKTRREQKELFAELMLSPVMHTDCTNAKVNGKSAHAFVCATPDGKAMYFFREKKGHEGVKGTPVEGYLGTLVHDHDLTFYHYGTEHQECLSHVLRYLKDSMKNEPERTWSGRMHSLVREMIHYRNGLDPEDAPVQEEVGGYEARYFEILDKAREEYEYDPPNKYYKEGYNLYRRMKEYGANHLLFLHDHKVPPTNNEAERRLRNYKRKQQQVMSFRSTESVDSLCQGMNMLILMRQEEGRNIFKKVAQIFG